MSGVTDAASSTASALPSSSTRATPVTSTAHAVDQNASSFVTSSWPPPSRQGGSQRPSPVSGPQQPMPLSGVKRLSLAGSLQQRPPFSEPRRVSLTSLSNVSHPAPLSVPLTAPPSESQPFPLTASPTALPSGSQPATGPPRSSQPAPLTASPSGSQPASPTAPPRGSQPAPSTAPPRGSQPASSTAPPSGSLPVPPAVTPGGSQPDSVTATLAAPPSGSQQPALLSANEPGSKRSAVSGILIHRPRLPTDNLLFSTTSSIAPPAAPVVSVGSPVASIVASAVVSSAISPAASPAPSPAASPAVSSIQSQVASPTAFPAVSSPAPSSPSAAAASSIASLSAYHTAGSMAQPAISQTSIQSTTVPTATFALPNAARQPDAPSWTAATPSGDMAEQDPDCAARGFRPLVNGDDTPRSGSFGSGPGTAFFRPGGVAAGPGTAGRGAMTGIGKMSNKDLRRAVFLCERDRRTVGGLRVHAFTRQAFISSFTVGLALGSLLAILLKLLKDLTTRLLY